MHGTKRIVETEEDFGGSQSGTNYTPMQKVAFSDEFDDINYQPRKYPTPSFMSRVKCANYGDDIGNGSGEAIDADDGTFPKRRQASQNGIWNPVMFGKNYLFNEKEQVPYSKAYCDEQFEKLLKKNHLIDYYFYLQEAEKHFGNDDFKYNMCLSMAFNTQMMNLLIKKSKETKPSENVTSSFVVPCQGFSIDKAREEESPVPLPGGIYFLISEAITPTVASNWSSSSFDTDVKCFFRVLFKQVADRDTYFIGYAAPKSSTAGYVPIGDPFYEEVSKFTIRAFGQHPSATLQTKVIRMARECLTNLLDRMRQNQDKTISAKAASCELKEFLCRYGKNFRREKMSFNTESVMTLPIASMESQNSTTLNQDGSKSQILALKEKKSQSLGNRGHPNGQNRVVTASNDRNNTERALDVVGMIDVEGISDVEDTQEFPTSKTNEMESTINKEGACKSTMEPKRKTMVPRQAAGCRKSMRKK